MFAMDQLKRFMHSNIGNYFRLFIILSSFSSIFINAAIVSASAQPACPTTPLSCQAPTGTYLCEKPSTMDCVAAPTPPSCPPMGHSGYTELCIVGGAPLTGSNAVICSITSIYTTVISAIFIIGLMLMILGGSLYAGAHLMPGATKGTLQGYGMGMVLGGAIGLIIAVLAPFILSVITGSTVGAAFSSANAFCAK